MTTNEEQHPHCATVTIGLASPDDIRSWSFGEVTTSETFDDLTSRPIIGGLYCERIFGSENEIRCTCQTDGLPNGEICGQCGGRFTGDCRRQDRMGHIELAAPVVHSWFFMKSPSQLSTILDIAPRALNRVIYYRDHVVLDPGQTSLRKGQVLTDEEMAEANLHFGDRTFLVGTGAEAIQQLLTGLNLFELANELTCALRTTSNRRKKHALLERLKVVAALCDSPNKPEWMVLNCLPVISAELRPHERLESSKCLTRDLNVLYSRIIDQNIRLERLITREAPESKLRENKRLLQRLVDSLFDNACCHEPLLSPSQRPLISLTDAIASKPGKGFRNRTSKRVDYSARSVMVADPSLQLHQCGLPITIAWELFRPFIIRRMMRLGEIDTLEGAERMLNWWKPDDEFWESFLTNDVAGRCVLLSRASTFLRESIQAFEPVLASGKAIRVHPLVCKSFNTELGGDQITVHLPLSIEAQAEATTLMTPPNHLFSPANGSRIYNPSQDIVMGCYYLTLQKSNQRGDQMIFASMQEVHTAFQSKKVTLQTNIKVRIPKDKRVRIDEWDEVRRGGLIETTVGRVLFNDILPPTMAFYNKAIRNNELTRIIDDCHRELGGRQTVVLLDRIKEIGFHASTQSGLSFGTSDLTPPDLKDRFLTAAMQTVMKKEQFYERGVITNQERYYQVLDAWTHAKDQITAAMMEAFKNDQRDSGSYVNPVFLMAESGARGGIEELCKLSGMRRLMTAPNGSVSEIPIRSSYREGLSVVEYFLSTQSVRKELLQTKSKTVQNRNLTHKLADVCRNIVVTCHDCGTADGITCGVIYNGDVVEVSLKDAVRGRVNRRRIVNPMTQEIIVEENELITSEVAQKIEHLGLEKILIRSPMTCKASNGICRLCYGIDLSTGSLVEQGSAVGIIAAQSIGEPGVRLKTRIFRFGIGSPQWTDNEIKSRWSGVVQYRNLRCVTNVDGHQIVLSRKGEILVLDSRQRERGRYSVPCGARLTVVDNQEISVGAVLCTWDPHAIPILSEVSGTVYYRDLVEGRTFQCGTDPTGETIRHTVIEHRGDLYPRILLEDSTGKILDFYHLPERATFQVNEGQQIVAGTVIAMQPREIDNQWKYYPTGFDRVHELFEAKSPQDSAVLAETDGEVDFAPLSKDGKRRVLIRGSDGTQIEQSKHSFRYQVRPKDHVRAGEAISWGRPDPHDLLRILGAEVSQQHLLREIQANYRIDRLNIDDKHIEVVLSQMFRMVKVEEAGDTGLIPGTLVDRSQFAKVNEYLTSYVRVTDPADSSFSVGEIVRESTIVAHNTNLEALHCRTLTSATARPAKAIPQLLGITELATQIDSWLWRASIQDPRKVLTNAAIAGKSDRLNGLKESAIVGQLMPAGTGQR